VCVYISVHIYVYVYVYIYRHDSEVSNALGKREALDDAQDSRQPAEGGRGGEGGGEWGGIFFEKNEKQNDRDGAQRRLMSMEVMALDSVARLWHASDRGVACVR
jgi:hypothetical protein